MKFSEQRLAAVVLSAFVAGVAALTAGCGQSAQSTEASSSQAATPPGGSANGSETAAFARDTGLDEQPEVASSTGNGMEALGKAAAAGRYLFAFFWKADDEGSQELRRTFDSAMTDFGDRTEWVAVKITEREQAEIVEKYELDRAPMPIVLAFAPNGAITGGFPNSFTASDLETAFVSPGTAQCVKALQENKLALLCVQNEHTKLGEEAMKGVQDFKNSQAHPDFVQVVKLDPKDSVEAKFLGELQISPDTDTAVTVMLAPPGVPIGMIEGATSKELFVDFLSKAQSACAGGQCGPGGCGPAQ